MESSKSYRLKGSLVKNKFLDISLKKNEENTLKIFEIYSDIPDPFIKEYDFFEES